MNPKQPVFILALVSLLFYSTSLFNEYALDDGIVIHQNNYVLRGISGICDILTHDDYDSFYKRMNASDQLAGGRYRPIPMISYAIEQTIIGSYRTGYYIFTEDINRNGKLDDGKVIDRNSLIRKSNAQKSQYEYNDYVDVNEDGVAQPNECYMCWDHNHNFVNDPGEDVERDGVFNEVDCQVYGSPLRHFTNIALYVLACVLFYLLLRDYIFKGRGDMAFLAALIFAIHPVHSEVVANVKGRDEIFSFIFIVVCLMRVFRSAENNSLLTMSGAAAMFFLALMSKEYAAMLLLIVPIGLRVFYNVKFSWSKLGIPSALFVIAGVGMIMMDNGGAGWILLGTVPLTYFVLVLLLNTEEMRNRDMHALMCLLYTAGLALLAIRLNAVNMTTGVEDNEVLNNPYLFANPEQRFATKVYVMLKYLYLVFFPVDLKSDYSWASIAYRELSSPDFIASAVINLALFLTGIWLVVRKHVLGFAIMVYFLFLIMECNFFFANGVMMLEAILFHPSMGFSIAMAFILVTLLDKLISRNIAAESGVMVALMLIITAPSLLKVWERNAVWKNDITLFLTDVKTAPHSVLALGNAGARLIDLSDSKEVTMEDVMLKDDDKVYGDLIITPEEVRGGNFHTKREAVLTKGIHYLDTALKFHPTYVNGYLNLGLAYYKLGNDTGALNNWKRAEKLYPNNPYLFNYYMVFKNVLNKRASDAFRQENYWKAIDNYKLILRIDSNDADTWKNLAGAAYNLHDRSLVDWSYKQAIRLDPEWKNQDVFKPFIFGLEESKRDSSAKSR